jgi:predicted  nucleic acid-binding Zn-ribbon protein
MVTQMSNGQNKQLQTAIDNLALILQLWVPVLEEIKKMNQTLESLPNNLSILQDRINKFNQANTYIQKTTLSQESLKQIERLQGVETQLQFLTNNLDGEIPQLLKIEKQIGNLIALRERVEALQEQCQINQAKYLKKVQ